VSIKLFMLKCVRIDYIAENRSLFSLIEIFILIYFLWYVRQLYKIRDSVAITETHINTYEYIIFTI
jgi:hypothetical protein